jgi:nucleoid DNA-binding protein
VDQFRKRQINVIINSAFSHSTLALVRREKIEVCRLCELSHAPAKRVLFFKAGIALRERMKSHEIG